MRQRKEVRKELSIQIRVTVEQKKILGEAATKAGLGLSSWLLTTGLRAATTQSTLGSALAPAPATAKVVQRRAPCLGTRESAPEAVTQLDSNGAEVRDALVGLGFKRGLADAAVLEARDRLGVSAPFQTWIREALQICGKPA